jgi:hypothetical protein
MLVNKSANDTDSSNAGDGAGTSTELGGEGGAPSIISGCPDPKNCTDPKLRVDNGSGEREAA